MNAHLYRSFNDETLIRLAKRAIELGAEARARAFTEHDWDYRTHETSVPLAPVQDIFRCLLVREGRPHDAWYREHSSTEPCPEPTEDAWTPS